MAKQPKSKYQPLFDLGDERLKTIEAALKSGTSEKSLAKRIHVEWESMLDWSELRLKRLLESYRKDFVERQMMLAIEQSGVLTQIRKSAMNVSLYDEMMLSVAAQRQRLESALEAHAKLPKGLLVEQHGREIERYAGVVERALRMQMEMGIVPRVPKKMQGLITRDPENPNMLRFEVTEGMLEAVAEVEELLGEEIDGSALVPA